MYAGFQLVQNSDGRRGLIWYIGVGTTETFNYYLTKKLKNNTIYIENVHFFDALLGLDVCHI